MKWTFVGTGSAFTVAPENYHSNCLLELGGDTLLLDCGSDARHALERLNLSSSVIENVYVSHLHSDHAGGLEWLGFSRKFSTTCDRPTLYIHRSMQTHVWEKLLSAAMSSIKEEPCALETFFNPVYIDEGFQWQGANFTCVQMEHVFNDQQPQPCYGLFVEVNKIKIFYTADTRYTPERLRPYYESADIIFQDCETSAVKSGVHAHYSDLSQLPELIKQKMWLYHYNPGPLPQATDDGFLGFVQPRQTFNFDTFANLKDALCL